MSRMSMRVLLLAAAAAGLALAGLGGCHSSRTEVVVIVTTAPGVEVGRDFEFLHFNVRDVDANQTEWDSQQVFVCPVTSGCYDLPVTLTLVPGNKAPDNHVRVQVDAGKRQQSQPVVSDASVFKFVSGQSSTLEFVLYPACLNKDCASQGDLSCNENGQCAPLAPHQFSGELDFASAGDLAGADFAVAPDMASTDLAGADFAVPPDFSMPRDFAVPPDMTCVPDCSGIMCGPSPNCPGVMCPNTCTGLQSCNGNNCVTCSNTSCSPQCCNGLTCVSGGCVACGHIGMRCCGQPPTQAPCLDFQSECNVGVTPNMCEHCGNGGELCCGGSSCSVGFTCMFASPQNRCFQCGDLHEPCCGGTSCNGALMCNGSTCEEPPDMAQDDGPCGGSSQPCCGGLGGTCNQLDLNCDFGICTPCGQDGIECCDQGVQCYGGLVCDPGGGGTNTCGPPITPMDGGGACGVPPLPCCAPPSQMCSVGMCCMMTKCFDQMTMTQVSGGHCYVP
jgi:hypothetical protein